MLEIASLKRKKISKEAIEGDAIAKKELSARLTSYQNLLFNSLFINLKTPTGFLMIKILKVKIYQVSLQMFPMRL